MDIEIVNMSLDDIDNLEKKISDFDNFWNINILKDELNQNNSYYIVAKNQSNEIVGFAGIKIILDEAELMNIVCKKDSRQNGIGSILLENLILFCKNNKIKAINLEVNENNTPAINLYKKYNFKQNGIRKNYYRGANAILMSKRIINKTV